MHDFFSSNEFGFKNFWNNFQKISSNRYELFILKNNRTHKVLTNKNPFLEFFRDANAAPAPMDKPG